MPATGEDVLEDVSAVGDQAVDVLVEERVHGRLVDGPDMYVGTGRVCPRTTKEVTTGRCPGGVAPGGQRPGHA